MVSVDQVEAQSCTGRLTSSPAVKRACSSEEVQWAVQREQERRERCRESKRAGSGAERARKQGAVQREQECKFCPAGMSNSRH